MGEIRSKRCEGRELTKDQLAGSQLDLLQAVTTRLDIPVVLVLINCRPATFGGGP